MLREFWPGLPVISSSCEYVTLKPGAGTLHNVLSEISCHISSEPGLFIYRDDRHGRSVIINKVPSSNFYFNVGGQLWIHSAVASNESNYRVFLSITALSMAALLHRTSPLLGSAQDGNKNNTLCLALTIIHWFVFLITDMLACAVRIAS